MLDHRSPVDLVTTVATTVRHLRSRAGMSLADLGQAAGVAKSTLAEIERGRANPSIETLWAVARALGVPFGRLVEPAEPEVHVVRSGEGIRVSAQSAPYEVRLVTSATRRGSFELYVVESEPGTPYHAAAHAQGSVEHVLVLSGRMRVGPVGAATELGAGDLVTFAADEPHLYESLAPDTTALLLMDYR